MSAPETPAAPAAKGGRRPRSMNYRKSSTAPRPTPEQTRRQTDVIQSAWRHFGEPGPAIAFLNTRHAGLAAQPLHLAIESDEGLGRVQQLLADMAQRAAPTTRR